MPYGRLADTDPDAWYRAAWRIDQACLANEAFQSVLRSTPSGPTKTVSARPPPMSVVRLPPAPPLLVTPKPPPPAPLLHRWRIFCGNVAWDTLYTPGFHYWNLL